MTKNNIYVNRTDIKDDGFDEMDFELYEEFDFNYDEYDNFIVIQKNQMSYNDGTPISIDKLIDKLNNLKLKGATHVEIEDNCDHHGYEINGVIYEKSSEDDIKQYLNKLEEDKQDKKEKQKAFLLKQIEELEKE